MPLLTFDSMVTRAQLYAQDTDGADPGLTLLQYQALVQDAYSDFVAAFPDLVVDAVGTIVFVAGTYSYQLVATNNLIFRELTMGATIGNGRAIERCNLEEMYGLIGTLTGTPRSWAARRATNNMFTWTIFVVPTPNASGDNLRIYGHRYPADLAIGQTAMGIGDAESEWVSRIAAARAAGLLGRTPDFINNLWRELPQNIQNEMRVIEGAKRPFSTPNEIVT